MAIEVRMSKRRLKRLERADKVCRELRYLIAERGQLASSVELLNLLHDWMRVSGKDKYERPDK